MLKNSDITELLGFRRRIHRRPNPAASKIVSAG